MTVDASDPVTEVLRQCLHFLSEQYFFNVSMTSFTFSVSYITITSSVSLISEFVLAYWMKASKDSTCNHKGMFPDLAIGKW